MIQKTYYQLGLILTLPIMFVTSVSFGLFLPRSVVVPLWTTIGLLLDLTGALIALFPDLTSFKNHFEPTEKIDRVETAQNRLFLDGEINKKDGYNGFNELTEILGEDRDVKVPPDRITAGSGGWGSAARVHFRYEKDDWSPEDYEGDREHPHERYDSESIGPTGVMDSRVSQRMNEYRERGYQFGFITGLSLLTTGFALQLCSVIYQNFGVIIP